MSILRDNPVFAREARWWLRLSRLRRNKASLWMAGVVALAVLYCYGIALNALVSGENTGPRLWLIVTNLLLVLVVLLAPALSAAAITQEREQQTWETLTSTPLTAGEVLIGKWLARLIPLGLLLTLAAPLLFFGAMANNISALGVALAVLFLVLTGSWFSMIGLTCSFLARKTTAALMISMLLTAVICIGTYVLDALVAGLLGTPAYGGGSFYARRDFGYYGIPALTWINPFFCLAVLTGRIKGATDRFSMGTDDVWSAHPASVLGFYVVVILTSLAVCLYYMRTRYRRDVRGGRILGGSLK